VLHFGAAAPRKNTRRLLEGWSLLDRSSRARAKLVIVGLNASSKAQLMLVCERLGISSSVVLHCFADEEHLPALMRGALALAYPSLAEGFGLPILDAWATDTPVLTSNCSCLPEVAGDAAILVEPSPRGIAAGLRRALEPETAARLRVAGPERAARYTQESMGRAAWAAVREAA
jgi:alpha-1,3-rhamnosyl/mannosyltransferase